MTHGVGRAITIKGHEFADTPIMRAITRHFGHKLLTVDIDA
jgi:hypothetical protein